MKKTWMYKCLPVGQGVRCVYFPINASQLEDYHNASPHKMAYHILLTGCNPDTGSIRVDWDIFYEGTPDYSVYN